MRCRDRPRCAGLGHHGGEFKQRKRQLRQERQLWLTAAVRVMRQRMDRVAGIVAAVLIHSRVRMGCAMVECGILACHIRVCGHLVHLAPGRKHRLCDQAQQKQQQRSAAQDRTRKVADVVGHDGAG